MRSVMLIGCKDIKNILRPFTPLNTSHETWSLLEEALCRKEDHGKLKEIARSVAGTKKCLSKVTVSRNKGGVCCTTPGGENISLQCTGEKINISIDFNRDGIYDAAEALWEACQNGADLFKYNMSPQAALAIHLISVEKTMGTRVPSDIILLYLAQISSYFGL